VRAQARPSQPTEAKTSRLSARGSTASPAPITQPPDPERPARTPAPASPAPPPPPSDGQTRAIPVPTNRADTSDTGDNNSNAADPTAALPVMRSEGNDSDAATEKLNARGEADKGDPSRQRRRAGGGVSAQDLLRREGRL